MYKYLIACLCAATVANNFGMEIVQKISQKITGNPKMRALKRTFNQLNLGQEENWGGKNLKNFPKKWLVGALKNRIQQEERTYLRNQNLAGWNLTNLNLITVDLTGCTANNTTTLEGTSITGLLDNENCLMMKADFSQANLKGANMGLDAIFHFLFSQDEKKEVFDQIGKLRHKVKLSNYITSNEQVQGLVASKIVKYKLNCTGLVPKIENGQHVFDAQGNVVHATACWSKKYVEDYYGAYLAQEVKKSKQQNQGNEKQIVIDGLSVLDNWSKVEFKEFNAEHIIEALKLRIKNHQPTILKGHNLAGWNLEGVNLSDVSLQNCIVPQGTNLKNSKIFVRMCSDTLKGADLCQADLEGAQLNYLAVFYSLLSDQEKESAITIAKKSVDTYNEEHQDVMLTRHLLKNKEFANYLSGVAEKYACKTIDLLV